MISQVLSKILRGKVRKVILITVCWQSQPWYPQALKMSTQNPVLLPQSADLMTDPWRENSPNSYEPNSVLSGVGGLRDRLSRNGISEKAANLISKSRIQGTL